MKTLVAYASKHGSTAEIAEAITEELCGAGIEAECREAGEVRDLDDYDAVVLGSAVYVKRWRREARAFLRRHSRALAAKPFWVFSSGPCGKGADPDEGGPDLSWSEPAGVMRRVERLNAREHVVFGGRVPPDPGNFVERAMLRDTPEELLDVRDWDEIRGWARGIASRLGERAPFPVG